jgi:hypothetical protein
MGRMVFSLPRFGFAINAFGNPALLAALMFGFGFITVMLMGPHDNRPRDGRPRDIRST